MDTHAHLSSPRLFAAQKRTALDLILGLYVRDDLRSMGFDPGLLGPGLAHREKWESLKPFLAKTRNTTYFQVVEIIFADLFGLEGDLLDRDWADISGPVDRSAERGQGWYDHVLKERCGLDLCLIDKGQATDFEMELAKTTSPDGSEDETWIKESPEKSGYGLFRPVLRIDLLAHAFKPGGVEAIQERFGLRVASFGEFEELLTSLIPDLPSRGFVALKSLLAYTTGLAHADPDRDKAARAWKKGLAADPAERRGFVDYVVWRLAELAGEAGLPFQIHTGISCCGARYLLSSEPHELVPLICSHPETKFDLFHAGFPALGQAAAMAKGMPNVFVNLNWLPAISGAVFKRYLSELLDLVPMTKIVWGSDAVQVEEVYAHSELTRRLLSAVLSEKIDQGRYGPDLCREIAWRLLRQNGIDLYGLELEPGPPAGDNR